MTDGENRKFSGYDDAVGDSIAVRARIGAHLPLDDGRARVGAQPHEVLEKIKGLKPEDVAGKTIVLSSGLTNNPSEISLVEEELRILTQEKHARVILLGVSNEHAQLSGYNPLLQEAARRHGALFVPLPSTRDDPERLHPPVRELVNSIRREQSGRDDMQVPEAKYGAISLPHGGSSRSAYLSKEALAPMSREQLGEIQELLHKVDVQVGTNRYDLGRFGHMDAKGNYDGKDYTLGDFTSHAIQDYERNHGLANANAEALIADLKKNVQAHGEPAEFPTKASHGVSAKTSGGILRKS